MLGLMWYLLWQPQKPVRRRKPSAGERLSAQVHDTVYGQMGKLPFTRG